MATALILIILLVPGWTHTLGRAEDAAQHYTTKSGDTLGDIARRYLPDETISPYQMMLALFQTNPEAFVDDNINNLRVGYRLRLPERETILTTGAEAAEAIVKRQYATWLQPRTAPEPAAPPTFKAASPSAPEPLLDTRLFEDDATRAADAALHIDRLRHDLALAQEQAVQRGLESEALRARVATLEERLIRLDDRLAEQQAAAERQQPPAEAPAAAAERPPASTSRVAARSAMPQIAILASGVILVGLALLWRLKRRATRRDKTDGEQGPGPPATDDRLAVDVDDLRHATGAVRGAPPEAGTSGVTRPELIIDLDDLDLGPMPHEAAAPYGTGSSSGPANTASTSRKAETESP